MAANVEFSSKTLETNPTAHFVFIHGAGHGAWCWYEVVTILEKAGYKATALDCLSAGTDNTSPDDVTSVQQYSKPLIDYLTTITDKVILVGHSLGGHCIALAMEVYPEKVSKSVFLSAIMQVKGSDISDPNSTLSKLYSNDSKNFSFTYVNGLQAQPTSLHIPKSSISNLYYNESPPSAATLAKLLMKAVPVQAVFSPFDLTPSRYGTVRRFYIKTGKDNAIPESSQQEFIDRSPVEKVFSIDESDHSSFLSHPRQLARYLEIIAKL
ncbi:hypothetical protein MPTK1_2g18920 [Marchantia polymorpha subsp. ruderalis]|nr:hypothetical protein MARPO_0128s0007 [Marchantia polymorpha]BBN02880.1 hypothetical protein Mp_2g18920 [Marchantia polymorpha subsp. ruderalis]|eukprot:PTQ30183.1 hypothetical protein MARPO_0128s0007 [Marchantia polymorpha]